MYKILTTNYQAPCPLLFRCSFIRQRRAMHTTRRQPPNHRRRQVTPVQLAYSALRWRPATAKWAGGADDRHDDRDILAPPPCRPIGSSPSLASLGRWGPQGLPCTKAYTYMYIYKGDVHCKNYVQHRKRFKCTKIK